MPPGGPRTPPEAPRYENANLIVWIFIDPDLFTETLRHTASDHWGKGGRTVRNR